MAWEAGFARRQVLLRAHIRPDADFIVNHGPAYGEERWEEHMGYSPSTIASEIAGLTAAAHLAQQAGDPTRARLYQATADDYQRNVKSWTVTDTGPYGDHRYFIRLSPTGDPNAAETYNLNNGSLNNVDQRSVVDAGFLELTRLGELPADDPDVQTSLKIVDSILERQTPSGPGWHRYGVQSNGSTDGYGDCYEPDPTSCSPSGAPSYNGVGSGHLWPIFDGERAEQELQTGDRAGAENLALDDAPHVLGHRTDARAGLGGPGHPGRALRLESGHGIDRLRRRQGGRLGHAADLGRGPVRAADPRPADRHARRPTGDHPQPLRDRRPADRACPSRSPSPAQRRAVERLHDRHRNDHPRRQGYGRRRPAWLDHRQHDRRRHHGGSDGQFSATVPTPTGSDLITVAVNTGPHCSGWAQETVAGS